MFRNRNSLVRFTVKSGDKVVVRAKTSLYEGRGDYQLIVEHMEDAGFGLLQRRYEELKQKLEHEGLFSPEHKQPLPTQARHIAVITSPTGAAIRDVLSVLRRRCPSVEVTIIPVQVQGDASAAQMVSAIDLAHERGEFDVILLCRGGGSIEDLWSFNSEALARRIFAATLPVVSAVGHETDFTIADFVADVRAPTPSAAAEILSPDQDEYRQALRNAERRLTLSVQNRLHKALLQLSHLQRLLRHPGQRLQALSQRLDQLEIRLLQSWSQCGAKHQQSLANLHKRLHSRHPGTKVRHFQDQLRTTEQRLNHAVVQQLKHKSQALTRAMGLLHIVSPLKTLERGYSITRRENLDVVRSSQQVSEGEALSIKLHEGELSVEVKQRSL